jgi:hypothetical protein
MARGRYKLGKSAAPVDNRLGDLVSGYWRYCLDVGYDRVRAYDHEERCAGDYCRCETIQNIRVKEVYLDRIVEKIQTKLFPSVSVYAINRVAVATKLYDTGIWEVGTVGGYYGEELGDVRLNVDRANTVYKHLVELEGKNETATIKYLLVAEYGYLLAHLKDLTFSSETVPTDSIIFAQEDYYRRLDGNIVDKYADIKYERAVVVKSGDKYKIIDGYHRCAAAVKNHLKTVKVFVGK